MKKKTKTLKMVEPINRYSMKKRGIVAETIGIIILVGILVVGGISSYKILSEDRYVGDTSNGEYYDLSKCIVDTHKNTIIKFNNENEAIQSGLRSAECNK